MADMFDGGFVEVYSSTTGEKQLVPADWPDHPVLSKGIRKTPLSKSDKATPAVPTEATGNTADPTTEAAATAGESKE